MKLKFTLLLLILSLSLNIDAQEKYTISTNYKDLSFTEFATAVEKELPVKFFFLDEWVKDLKIG